MISGSDTLLHAVLCYKHGNLMLDAWVQGT